MNNNNINAVLEAVGDLDDSVLESVFKPKRKRPIALIAVTAAAAALSLMVGFTLAYRNNVTVNGKQIFEYNIKIHDEVTPPPIEELAKMGADIRQHSDNIYEYVIRDIDPRGLIEKYNIIPLGNENFSRADLGNYSTPDYDADEYRRIWLSKTRVTVADDYHADGMYGSYVDFMYWLADNRMNIPVNFRVLCVTGKYNALFAQEITSVETDGSDIGVIGLNNNEKAVIHQTVSDDGDVTSIATFTYDGMLYYVHARTGIDGMEQILTDLGIISE